MTPVPRLPPGQVGVIAVAGTLALLGFAATTAWLASKRRGRDAGWAALPLVLGLATMALRAHPGWHVVASTVVLACALRDAACFERGPRWSMSAAAVAWIVAMGAARATFH